MTLYAVQIHHQQWLNLCPCKWKAHDCLAKKKIRKAYDQEQVMYIYREKWTNNGVTYGINKETAVSMKEMSCWSNVKHSPEGMLY